MPTVRYSFSFDTGRDAAIIGWLDSQPNASAAVREAIQACIASPSRADLAAQLNRLLEMMRNMRVVEAPAQETPAGDEPAEARRGLDAMKAKFAQRAAGAEEEEK